MVYISLTTTIACCMVTEQRQKFNSLLITMYTYIHIYMPSILMIHGNIKKFHVAVYTAPIYKILLVAAMG